jgi:hypothetical protein
MHLIRAIVGGWLGAEFFLCVALYLRRGQSGVRMQRTFVIVLASGDFLGPNGDPLDSSLDAVQFDSFDCANEVSKKYQGSAVTPVEPHVTETARRPEPKRDRITFQETWPH